MPEPAIEPPSDCPHGLPDDDCEQCQFEQAQRDDVAADDDWQPDHEY